MLLVDAYEEEGNSLSSKTTSVHLIMRIVGRYNAPEDVWDTEKSLGPRAHICFQDSQESLSLGNINERKEDIFLI